MTHRERIIAAIEHRPIDRIPTDYWGTGEVTNSLMTRYGVTDTGSLWKAMDIDKIIGVMPPFLGPMRDAGDGLAADVFGTLYAPKLYGGGLGTYYETARSPLAEFDTVDEIERGYVWPEPSAFDFEGVREKALRYPDYAIEAGYMAPFYIYTLLRGMERTYLDLAADPDLADYVIGKIGEFLLSFHRRLFEAGDGLIDIAQVTDDYGCQTGLLIGTAMFERFFKNLFVDSVSLTREFGIRIFHHDDGAVREMIPILRDLGIQVLNPIQWRLPGMDLEGLKRDFGADLCFHGGIDNQDILPFGTESDVRSEVRHCIQELSSDGTGYILAPCHNIQPNTPVENIVAMYEEARSV